MVDVNQIERLHQQRTGGTERSSQTEARAAAKTVWTVVRDNLLKSGQNVRSQEDLGPMVQGFLRGLTDDLVKVVEAKTGKVPAAALKMAVDACLDLHGKERHVSRLPDSVTPANGELLGKVELRETPAGKYRVAGEASGEGHGLSVLLKGLGVNLGGLEEPVANIIEKAATSRNNHNLGRKETWQKVGREVLTAVLLTPGTPHTKGVAAALAGVGALSDALNQGSDSKVENSAVSLGLGLPKTAGTETGKGTVHNATNIRAALMTETSTKRPSAAAILKGGVLGVAEAGDREGGLRNLRRRSAQLARGLAESMGVEDPDKIKAVQRLAQGLVMKPNVAQAAEAVFKSLGVDDAGGGGVVGQQIYELFQATRAAEGGEGLQARVLATALAERIGGALGAEPGWGAAQAKKILEAEETAEPPRTETAPKTEAGPKLIDRSKEPAPEELPWPAEIKDNKPFLDFMDKLLGPEGIGAKPDKGGNTEVAFAVAQLLFPAFQKASAEAGQEEGPKFAEKVLAFALEAVAPFSPLARALLDVRETGAISGAEARFGKQAEVLKGKLEAAEKVETLAKQETPPPKEFKALLRTIQYPPAMAEAHASLADALEKPETEKSQATLKQHLKEAQSLLPQLESHHGGGSPVVQAQKAHVSLLEGALNGQPSTPDREARIRDHREASAELKKGPQPSPAEWARTVSAEARKTLEALDTQKKSFDGLAKMAASEGQGGWTRAASTALWNAAAGGGGGSIGGGGGDGPPRRPGGPGDDDPYERSERYITSLGGRNRSAEASKKTREDFDVARAVLEDPSLEFFDKMFLFMALMVNKLRNRIEEDQIEQLDREERMWLNEQLAHEYQKEVEMAHRDIHEFGKKIDTAADTYAKAENALERLDKVPEAEREPDHDSKVRQAKEVLDAAKDDWQNKFSTFEQRKVVLNELRDSRDMHRVQIASDRRHIDIFAAKVKRNTHLVEMYVDMMKTFEDHRHRNLQRLWGG